MNSPFLLVRQVKEVVVDNVVHNEGRVVDWWLAVFLDYKANKLRKREFCSYCHVIIELDTRSTKSVSVFDTFKRSSQTISTRGAMLCSREDIQNCFSEFVPAHFQTNAKNCGSANNCLLPKISLESKALRSWVPKKNVGKNFVLPHPLFPTTNSTRVRAVIVSKKRFDQFFRHLRPFIGRKIFGRTFFDLQTSLPFELLVDFFDGLGGTLHCSKIGQNKAEIWGNSVKYTLKSKQFFPLRVFLC